MLRSPSSPAVNLEQQLANCANPTNYGAAVVGLEDEQEELVGLLSSPADTCQILNIVGPAGFGKLLICSVLYCC